jgi:thiamine pyrophosphokinase
MTCWIFVNGVLEKPIALRPLFNRWDTFYAVDGGLRFLRALEIKPDLVIGDLDSASQQDLQWARSLDTPFHRYEREKDATDLEEAVLAAVAVGFTAIRIAGAGGGRMDQILGNIFLLQNSAWKQADVRLDDGITEIFLTDGKAVVKGHPGDIVSLLPLGGNAEGVTTYQMQYPLCSETLFTYGSRGISNVMLNDEAVITIKSGLLIVVHIRGSENKFATGEAR